MVKKAEKDPVEPEKVAETAAEAQAAVLADYSWSVNAVKLNRAKAHVQEQQSAAGKPLNGKELEDAVKARYVALGGLLTSDKQQQGGAKRGGRVQNMAADDGSAE